MKKLKVNNSFDNKIISTLNLEFEENKNIDNNSIIKNSLNKLNSKMGNFNNNNNIIKLENDKINDLYPNKDQNEKEKIYLDEKSKIKNSYYDSSNSEIKKSELEFNKSEYKDKSCKNWDQITINVKNHFQNQQILNKLENENLNKKYFNENKRNYFFGRQKIQNLPYTYDISSTYMNNYDNKSEHKRHEILINELSKLRAYLIKYPNNNNIEIIKDFLIKYNIQNLEKYSNFQLLQLGKFVCQEDVYKINSLLKPYLHVKDMIYDILEDSLTLNNKFNGFKFNASVDKLLSKIDSNKKHENYAPSNKIIDKMNKNRANNNLNMSNSTNFNKHSKTINNKKFYISELDYSINPIENNDEILIDNNNILRQINDKDIKGDNNEEKCHEIKNENHKEFIKYSKKRKDLLDSIGIFIKKKPYDIFDCKDLYSSPLLKKNTNNIKKYLKLNINKRYQNKINNILQLPRINNKTTHYYKPNKLLLAPDKNYSSNFDLLLKDISTELKNFELTYQQKLDMIRNRNLSPNNSFICKFNNNKINNIKGIQKSQSCKLFDINDAEKIKKMEALNRLYYGKKSIKIDLDDIQKKHKLTEYIALANAKTHVKIDIINDNILKLYK
jgi:hypothetical protein